MFLRRPFIQGIAIFLIILPGLTQAQQSLQPFKTNNPPVIDGELNDSVWQNAATVTGFKTFSPDYGLDMVDETVVYMAYDPENLYFAFRCFDSEPDKIKASISSRDNIILDDYICLNLDSFNDQQTLYAFYVNPLGIQADSRFATGQEDPSYDLVWYSAGRIDERGYTVEMQVPLKSIRYSGSETVKMRVMFERKVIRQSVHGSFPELDPNRGHEFLTQTVPMIYHDLKKTTLFELLPAVTYTRNHQHDQGEWALDENKSEVSLTTKFGITSDLILDGTFNPDFSQVESDAGQVDFNQRFSLFYSEKRPFFLEGRENFAFGGSSAGDPLRAVVHTRTIVNPLTGIKLTGKVGSKNTMSAIYALDDLPEGPTDFAHVGIFRYRRTLNEDSFIGSFLTTREFDGHHNRLGGADAQLRLSNASRIGFHAFGSQTFDRDASLDNNGYALGLNYYYNTRNWLINMRMNDLSQNFQTETGYVTRTDATQIRFSVTPYIYPKSGFIQRIDPEITNKFVYDKPSGLWENNNYILFGFNLPKNSVVWTGAAYCSEIYMGQKFNRNHWVLGGQSQLTSRFYLSLSYWGGKMVRYIENPFAGKGSRISGAIVYQPSDKFNAELNLTYNDMSREDDGSKVFDYTIIRSKNTYQLNKYLFVRAIVEYNTFYEELLTDFLASFTYIPGTVIHMGYGSLYNKLDWNPALNQYESSGNFLEMRRGLFFKASYLWRM